MSERVVFKGRDGWWYCVEEFPSRSGSRIDMACLGSTDDVAGVPTDNDPAEISDSAGFGIS